MKVLNKIDITKTNPKDLALLAGAIAAYGVCMALAAGLALIGPGSDALTQASEAGNIDDQADAQ